MKRTLALTCCVAALAAACAERQTEDGRTAGAAAAPDRPDTLVDTLQIEGMPEATTSRLLRAPASFDLPFTTYVPEGIVAEFDPPGPLATDPAVGADHPGPTAAEDGGGVRFTAAFTGTADPQAYMHVRVYAAATPQPQPAEVVSAFLRSRRPQDDPVGTADVEAPYRQVEPPAWALEAHTFEYRGDGDVPMMGRVVLARHQDRIFHVLTHYPAEYADGLGPRFARILELWRWEDTGEMLHDVVAEDAPGDTLGEQLSGVR